jgi:hypothetical protein
MEFGSIPLRYVWKSLEKNSQTLQWIYTQFRQTLNKSLKNFQKNGSVGLKPGSGRPKKRTPGVIEEARQAVEEAPGTSIEHLSQQLGVSVGTCHSFVKKDLHLFPYRLTSVSRITSS